MPPKKRGEAKFKHYTFTWNAARVQMHSRVSENQLKNWCENRVRNKKTLARIIGEPIPNEDSQLCASMIESIHYTAP